MPVLVFPGGGGSSPPSTRPSWNIFEQLDRLPPALATEGYSSMVHWTQAELLTWANDAIRELLTASGLLVETDASLVTVASQSDYALPARALSVIDVSSASVKLRPATSQELAALDKAWATATATTAKRWTEGEGASEMRLYPIPTSAGDTIVLVFHRYLDDVSSGQPYVTIPAVLQDYAFHRALAAARSKESIAAMPEAAAFSDQVADLIREAAVGYWGGSQ